MTGRVRRWSYHVERLEGDINPARLDALGQNGWELIAAPPDPETMTTSLVFKRPAEDFRARITVAQRTAVIGSSVEADPGAVRASRWGKTGCPPGDEATEPTSR